MISLTPPQFALLQLKKMNDRQKTVVLTKALNHLTTGAALTKISSSVMQVKVAEDFGLNIGQQAVFK